MIAHEVGLGLRRRPRLGSERRGEADVDVRRRLAQRTGRLGEVVAGGRGAQRHPPGVLDAREELLREDEVAAEPAVAGRRVGPLAGDGAHDVRDLRRAGLGERRLDDDVGVLAGVEERKTLTMTGFAGSPSGIVDLSTMTEVLDCSPRSTAEARTATSGQSTAGPVTRDRGRRSPTGACASARPWMSASSWATKTASWGAS